MFIQKMDLKHVELYDEWETFMVRFTIFYPLNQKVEEMAFTSSRTGEEPIIMHPTKTAETWKNTKYGQHMRPFECIIKLPNDISGDEGQFNALNQEDQLITYQFQKINNSKKEILLEREPERTLSI